MKLFVGESDVRFERYLELVLDARTHNQRVLSAQKLDIVNIACVAPVFWVVRYCFKVAPSSLEVIFYDSGS